MTTTKKRWIFPAAASAGALIVGVGIGVATTGAAETTTPDACIEAIDLADEAILILSGTLDSGAAAIDAAAAYDYRGVESAVADIEADTSDIEDMTPDYHAAKADCRGAA